MITSTIIIFYSLRDFILSILNIITENERQEKRDSARREPCSEPTHEATQAQSVWDNTAVNKANFIEKTVINSYKPRFGSGLQPQITENPLESGKPSDSSMTDQYERERLRVCNPAISRDFLEKLESQTNYVAESTLPKRDQKVNSQETWENICEKNKWMWGDNGEESTPMSSGANTASEEHKDEAVCVLTIGTRCSEAHSPSFTKTQTSEETFSEKDCLNNLETLLYSEMKEEVVAALHVAFDLSNNPFSFVLYIIKFAAFDYCTNKKSLAYITLMEFEKWLCDKRHGLSEADQQKLGLIATGELKDSALEIVVTSKLMLFEPIKRIYQLDCGNNGFLEKHIRFLLYSRNKYKEAVVMASKLHLQTHFEPREILLPVIIQDKVQLAESYVSECPWQQKAFLSMLNRLCALTDEELENIAGSTLSPALIPKNHKLNHKALIKLAERLVKMFNLDPEDYPNVFKGKNLDGLLFLLRKKYSERGPSVKWDNLIETAIGGNKWLQLKLVESFVDLDDLNEAVRWSRYYGLSTESLPVDVQEALMYSQVKTLAKFMTIQEQFSSRFSQIVALVFTRLLTLSAPECMELSWENLPTHHLSCLGLKGLRESDKPSEDWEAEMEGRLESRQPDQTPHKPQVQYFHQLSLPCDRIRLVEDAPSLQYCLSRLCQPGTIVGFDSEWRPTMCRAGTSNKLAIIQLATHTEVFVLDMISLPSNVPNRLLQDFGECFFTSSDCLKLGYGVESDFQVLVSSCPFLRPALRNIKRFVDLCPLSKKVLDLPHVKQKLKHSETSKLVSPVQLEKGLSELVCHCLGRPLDKTYQVSDWERRPMLPEQLIYAALDAFCLLEVYDVLKAWVQQSEIDVNMESELPAWKWLFPEHKQTASHRRKRNKQGMDPSVFPPSVNKGATIAPGSLAIVVDTMLQGLGRQLRCCGVDVVIPESNTSHRQLVELRSLVPDGMCVHVPPGTVREQVATVLKYFNVRVKCSDLFSRCQVCNGGNYTKISAEHMRIAYDVAHSHVDPHSVQVSGNSPIDYLTLTINNGVPLKVGTVREEVLNKDRIFYCCSTCGRVFWEGSHFKNVKTQFAFVMDQSTSNETVYNI